MAHYKDFKKVYLGYSDIASLVVRDAVGVAEIKFGADGAYEAYECFGEVEIGEHYKLVYQAKGWLKIYDDEECNYTRHYISCRDCDIYRAGDFGIILHWH